MTDFSSLEPTKGDKTPAEIHEPSADNVTAAVAAPTAAVTAAAATAAPEPQKLMELSEEELKRLERLPENYEGFRLERVDVYNWGSFNNNVKTVYFGGQNVLMTGDNGAGKSSIIDAITVLLYDVKRIVFNQAAGAEKGERNLASYVLGLYKNDNTSGIKTEMGLRSKDKAVLSVIMASFYNHKLKEHVVLVQCMVMMKNRGAPARYYFISDRDFNLQQDVLPVKDIRELGQKLRKLGCTRYEQFSDYYRQMQRIFGIEGTKVLDLFYKTISMKSISNISDFVRKQMLEDFNGDELVEQMIERFNDLDEAYRSVEEARKQVEALIPICTRGEEFKTVNSRIAFLKSCSDGAPSYLYQKKSGFIKTELESYQLRMEQIEAEREKLKDEIEELKLKSFSTRDELAAHGGNRRDMLLQSISSVKKERENLYRYYTQYATCLRNLNLDPVESESDFNRVLGKLDQLKVQYQNNEDNCDQNLEKQHVELNAMKVRRQEVAGELESLRRRKNNIPSGHIAVRANIAAAVGCSESDLPFAGELMQIKAEEKATWEYAIEKVLHGFGLSMLVPEEYYRDVVNYVHTHNLGMRLVFYRIKENDFVGEGAGTMSQAFGISGFNRPRLSSSALPRKIEIKQDPVFHNYIRQHLERVFNFVCTEDQAEFRQERFALMPSGLSKRGGQNEKDDRRGRNGNDYILGWTNEEKIALLEQELSQHISSIGAIEELVKSLRRERSAAQSRISELKRLTDFRNYSAIDYRSKDAELAKLENELEELRRSSNIFEALTRKLEEYEQDLRIKNERRDNYTRELGQLQSRSDLLKLEYDHAVDLSGAAQFFTPELISAIERLIADALVRLRYQKLSHEIIERVINEVVERLKAESNKLGSRSSELSQELVSLQTNFTQTFVVAGRNLDASRADAWEDFKNFLDKLQQDDLPRFVDAFKEKLNRETIEQLGSLNAALISHSRKIRERIADINVIMKDVDFNPDHYIQMVATESPDLEIRQFRQDLRNCTSNMLASDWTLEEADRKFHEVKALIDRFKGEVNGADIDGRWRRKVTDVKQWYDFSASEHSRQDDSQVDYYEDSGGKSGGQKEKLAYTVLASSLAYQYRSRARRAGIDPDAAAAAAAADGSAINTTVDRSFRFVIIDEAFGRGSPQSVDYALTLFGRFNLQLLVATPMQKLDIIEKYVRHVAFVYRDEASHESTVVNYGLEDYILKRRLKEQLSRNTLSSNGLSAAAAKKLAELDKRIKQEQATYTGPRATRGTAATAATADGGSGSASAGSATAAVAASAIAALEAQNTAAATAVTATGATAQAAAPASVERSSGGTRDASHGLKIRDAEGNYLSPDELAQKQQQEQNKYQQQRTEEALSRLDFLDSLFNHDDVSVAAHDNVATPTAAPAAAAALAAAGEAAQAEHGPVVLEDVDDALQVFTAASESAAPTAAAAAKASGSRRSHKKTEQAEPQYRHSLEELLLDEDE